MKEIDNICSIKELSLYDKVIRKHCHMFICTNDASDDIVNSMYIKLNDLFLKNPNKVVSGGYVHLMLKHLHLQYLKYNVTRYDMGGATPYCFDDLYDDTFENIELLVLNETLYDIIDQRMQTLSWYELRLMGFLETMNLSELSRKSDISYRSLCYTYSKIKTKLGYLKSQKS